MWWYRACTISFQSESGGEVNVRKVLLQGVADDLAACRRVNEREGGEQQEQRRRQRTTIAESVKRKGESHHCSVNGGQ
jgi:hypothetical protein